MHCPLHMNQNVWFNYITMIVRSVTDSYVTSKRHIGNILIQAFFCLTQSVYFVTLRCAGHGCLLEI